MQRLRPDQVQSRLLVVSVRPTRTNAHHADYQRKKLRIADNGLLRVAVVGDPKNRKNEHRCVGQFSETRLRRGLRRDDRRAGFSLVAIARGKIAHQCRLTGATISTPPKWEMLILPDRLGKL